MTPEEFITSCRLRLGLSHLNIPEGNFCSCSANACIDKLGDHFLSCALGGYRIDRHERLIDVCEKITKTAQVQFSKNFTDLAVMRDRSDAHPDFVCTFSPQNDGPSNKIFYDATVVHSLASSYIEEQSKDHKHAMNCAKIHKNRKYSFIHDLPMCSFKALAFDSLGNFSDEVTEFVKNMAYKIAESSNLHFSVIKFHLEMDLSVTLHRGTARIINFKQRSWDNAAVNICNILYDRLLEDFVSVQ